MAPEVFYALLPQGRGRGAATDAVRLLTTWAHGQGIPRVHLLTLSGNEPSERVALRVGYVRGGTEADEQHGASVEVTRWVHSIDDNVSRPA
jgi:RimJ/RimL family protein N-acetyltransferase